jgi:hypothetical protein
MAGRAWERRCICNIWQTDCAWLPCYWSIWPPHKAVRPSPGVRPFWANSHEGRLFWHLVASPVANPVVVLEEIDKVSSLGGGTGERSALGALHVLLERSTARRFCDLALPELLLDASRVLWFATCNQIELVPEPIRQRFVTFEIPRPEVNQARQIATFVFAHLLDERGLTDVLERHLSEEVLSVLSALTAPRDEKAAHIGCGSSGPDGAKPPHCRRLVRTRSHSRRSRTRASLTSMDPVLVKKLVSRYPLFLREIRALPENEWHSRFRDCGDGWFDLVDQACTGVEAECLYAIEDPGSAGCKHSTSEVRDAKILGAQASTWA